MSAEPVEICPMCAPDTDWISEFVTPWPCGAHREPPTGSEDHLVKVQYLQPGGVGEMNPVASRAINDLLMRKKGAGENEEDSPG